MKRGAVVSISTVALIIAFLMLQLTTPHTVGPLGVLAFFVLIYIASAGYIFIGLGLSSQFLRSFLPKGGLLLKLESVSQVKLYYYASILGLAPVILMGMQSVGGVGLSELILLAAFEILGCFYISRRF